MRTEEGLPGHIRASYACRSSGAVAEASERAYGLGLHYTDRTVLFLV